MVKAIAGAPQSPKTGNRLKTAAMTLAILGLAAGLGSLGAAAIADRANAVAGVGDAPLLTVATTPLSYVDSYRIERRFVGQIEAMQQTDLAFEQGGTVTKVLVDDGDLVAADDVVANLDTRLLEADTARLEASRAALAAQAELSRRTNDRQMELHKQGFASGQALDQASFGLSETAARIAEIDAALAANRIRIEKAVIRSPFAGRVVTRHVDDGAAVQGGQPVISLLENANPRFRAGIDPSLASALAGLDGFSVEIDNRVLPARLVSLAPNVDPVTRTRIARFALSDEPMAVFGQTGSLIVDQTILRRGAWIPVPALQEGVRGLWQILTVGEEEGGTATVRPEAVEIIHADQDRAFVRGTFGPGARLIVDGPHRVVPGQRVAIAEAGN